MKLYHGTSYRDIAIFDLNKGRGNIDYGKGVYFTTNFEQAVEWSCRNSKTGAVYECDVDLSAFSRISFSKDDADTYYYIYLCRLGFEEYATDAIDGVEDADCIQGVMLDGRIKNFNRLAESFNEGEISFEEFKEAIVFYDNKNQICIKTKKVITAINENITKVYLTVKDEDGRVFIEE